ncbi:MAG TPA: LLM class flavin-dependent oxidoreductase [Actinomycetota bacterium]|nr:LLM class flavin-dependent oxidoreductase [Actinomycetota bacterium]
MTVRIGLGLFTGQLPVGSQRTFEQEYHDIVELSRLAETLGYDSVWVSEHHGSSDGYLPSLLPMLAGLATATDRVQLGTGVILTPFHHPLRLAEDAAVVDLLSGGRLILGLGLGWREEEFRMFEIPIRERVRRTTETVEILRKAWTGRRFDHEGRAFRLDRVKVTPAPAREPGPPIYLGGFVEDAVRRAGRLGDGYIRSRGGLEHARDSLAVAEDGAREAGKDPDALGFAQLHNAFVWQDGDAWEVVRRGATHQLGVYDAWREGADTPDIDTLEPAPQDEEQVRRLTPAGDPRAILRALRPWVDAFADRNEFHLVVRFHYPGMDLETAGRAVELFGEEVLPALKGA